MNRTFLITQIHATPVMAMVVITGGGTQAIADLLAVPGASRTVLEALIPYSDASLALMRESGCKMIFFGAETGNDEILKKMDLSKSSVNFIIKFNIRCLF